MLGAGEGGATGYDLTSDLGNNAGEMNLSSVCMTEETATDISVGDASACIVINDGRHAAGVMATEVTNITDSTSNIGNNAGSNSMTLLGDITMGVGDPKVKGQN